MCPFLPQHGVIIVFKLLGHTGSKPNVSGTASGRKYKVLLGYQERFVITISATIFLTHPFSQN